MHIFKGRCILRLAAFLSGHKWIAYMMLLLSPGLVLTVPAQAQDLPIDIQVIGNHRLEVGETLDLLLLARQPFGQVPWLFAEIQPPGSEISDNGDGTRTFSWTPQIQDVGLNTLRLVAVDDENQSVRATEEIYLSVLPADSFISRLSIIAPSNVIMRANEPVSIRVVAVDGDGLVPDLVALNLPTDASFSDNGDGSRSIEWTPPAADTSQGQPPVSGVFAVQASAADDPDDTVIHIISYVVSDEAEPYQQPRLEPLPHIFAPPAPSVVSGDTLGFRVEAFHSSSRVPNLMISNAPKGSTFEDNGDGSREFIWDTNVNDVGSYSVSFIAVDEESGETNTFESTLVVLANPTAVRSNLVISLEVPLTSLAIVGAGLHHRFDTSETQALIDLEFLVDSVDVIINESISQKLPLLPGSNRLVIDEVESGIQYAVDIDRATVADFRFTNEIGARAYDLDVDGSQIALSTFDGVLISTWNTHDAGYFLETVALELQPWSGPAASLSLSGDTLAVASSRQEGVWLYENEESGEWLQSAYLPPDPQLFSMGFGGRLALDDDTLVVSAMYDPADSVENRQDMSMPGSGAVAVYQREESDWVLQDILKASNPDAGDLFGYALALQGDTLIVGAVGEDSAASGINSDQANNAYAAEQYPGTDFGAGAAYIFERNNGIWEQKAYLKPSQNTVPRMGFGSSLAISDSTIAVAAEGAPYLPTGQFINGQPLRTGAIYMFDFSGSTWKESGIIRPTTNYTYSFGTDMALHGDQLAVAADREVILYQNINDSWRTLWSSNLLYGKVDFNSPYLIGAGVESFASSSLIFSSGE